MSWRSRPRARGTPPGRGPTCELSTSLRSSLSFEYTNSDRGRPSAILSGVSALAVSSKMRARLDEYGTFHTTRGNELCHFVGIPLIVAGFGGLFALVPLVRVGEAAFTLTELVLLAVVAFYLIEARLLGFVTAIAIVVLGELGRSFPLWLSASAFVFGWAVQFVGHAAFEHRSPAFVRNLLHLLVGPAWLVERAAAKREV